MIERRLLVEWIVLLSLGIALSFLAARGGVTDRLDAVLLDRSAALARAPASDDILIVAIDDRGLEQIGAWPWPREVHARIVDELAQASSGPVLFDVLFLDPGDPADDAAFARAMAAHGEVFLPMTLGPAPNAVAGTVAELPIRPLAEVAAGIGHVAITPDEDGVLRRFDLLLPAEGRYWEHFSVAAAGSELASGERPIVSFHPQGSYAQVSATDIVQGSVPEEFLRGKTVLVGATAQGMGDRYSVGAGGVSVLPGVETQANLLDALRSGGLVSDTLPFWSGLLAALALLAQFLVFWKATPRNGLAATFAIGFAVVLTSAALVPLAGVWVAPGVAVLAVLLAYPLWSWRRLTSVSAYLEEEAASLRPEGAERAEVKGFDRIARQVERMRRLVGNVSRGFAFLRKIIEAAPDAILVLDRNGAVTTANARAHALFTDIDDDAPEPLDTLLARSGAAFDADGRDLVFADERIMLVARAALELDEDGGSGEIVALRDVTDTRARERERAEMLEFLSHDMRTPQVAIIGLTQRLGGSKEVGGRIRNQAERTLKLADTFVQIARLAEAAPEFEETDLGGLIEEACDRAYAPAKAKSIA
ncbi:MAG: CHASE2 domain-containing protein, partial [Alteraurantiacibacter sp.]